MFQDPVGQIFVRIFVIGLIYFVITYFLPGGLDGNTMSTLFDIILFGFIFLLSLALYSQFVLPVQTWEQRMKVFERVLGYISGSKGPAIFIENGEIRQRKGEEERKGPGVVLLDTASAAILRTGTTFIEPAMGPGLVFTKAKQYLGGVVDLYPKSSTIGPKDHEDPFAESEETKDKQRRYLTSGLTRDGVEVIPRITVNFRLNSMRGVGNTQFGFDADAVLKAVAGEAIDSESAWKAIAQETLGSAPDKALEMKQDRVRWHDIPVFLAVDLWREYLSKFTFSDLFELKPVGSPGSGQTTTAYEEIAAYVKARLTQPEVTALDYTGQKIEISTTDSGGNPIVSHKKEDSLEFKILQGRGIRVTNVRISNPRFPKDAEEKLIENWKSSWLGRAKQDRTMVEQKRSYAARTGNEKALKEFALWASRYLAKEAPTRYTPDKPGPDPSLSLELLVRGTLRLCVNDPSLHKKVSEIPEIPELDKITDKDSQEYKDLQKIFKRHIPENATHTRLVNLIEWIRKT